MAQLLMQSPAVGTNLGAIGKDELTQILASHTAINLAIFDLDIKFLYLNEAAFHLVSFPRGLTEEQVIGYHWKDIGISELHLQPIEDAIRYVINSGKPFSGQHTYTPSAISPINQINNEPEFILDHDGQRIFEYHIKPLYNDKNQLYRVAVSAEDVTKLKIAKHTARAYQISEQRLHAITEALPVLIAHVDHEMRYTYNSPYYAQLLGRPLSEITGQFLWDVIGSEAFKDVEHYVKAALSGKKQNYQVTVKDENDKNNYFQTVMIPQIAGEDVTGYYAITFDVTDLAEAQEKTLTQERYLAHMNRLTTVNEMTSNIAHELNQPLTAINNYASVLNRFLDQLYEQLPCEIDAANGSEQALAQMQELRQDIRHALSSITQQTTRASKIVKDVRAFVRQYGDTNDQLDIDQLIEDVLSFVQSTLVDRQTTVQFTSNDNGNSQPKIVNGEATQLQQVLINLILNAVDVMEPIRKPNDRRINITIQQSSNSGHEFYEISVQDNGAPLTEDDIKHIFTPFYTTKKEGMGMGLAICTSIAEAHGGGLSAKPNDTQGLTMVLTLPKPE